MIIIRNHVISGLAVVLLWDILYSEAFPQQVQFLLPILVFLHGMVSFVSSLFYHESKKDSRHCISNWQEYAYMSTQECLTNFIESVNSKGCFEKRKKYCTGKFFKLNANSLNSILQ